jgi:hypothetical protein
MHAITKHNVHMVHETLRKVTRDEQGCADLVSCYSGSEAEPSVLSLWRQSFCSLFVLDNGCSAPYVLQHHSIGALHNASIAIYKRTITTGAAENGSETI